MESNNTLIVFKPFDNEPPVSNYATLDLRNNHPVLDFDDSTNESAIFTGVMPRIYNSGGITVHIHYSMTSATTGDVDWDVSFENIGDQQQDLDSDGFAAVKSVDNNTVPATSGNVDIISLSFTTGSQMDNINVGDTFRMKITRDAISDTGSGDAELVAIEIRET